MDNNCTIINNLPDRFAKSLTFAKEQIALSPLSVHIFSIIFYGSCTKQKIKYNSDIDLLLVVDDSYIFDKKGIKEFRNLRNILLDFEDGAPIDIKIISLTSWNKNDSIYLKNVHREGIVL